MFESVQLLFQKIKSSQILTNKLNRRHCGGVNEIERPYGIIWVKNRKESEMKGIF